ncbi:hypothetical protein Dda_1090 [Drechslerella dactyloides]|uniref:Uncharacterized protein n=1 Tax=Drechslerella dactyloides TaxID=74499 RepID=A0AAD6NNM2_DREDA|nr:hypothetical protein Dda_1090 [Drechslerella dactyloides]
MYKLVLVLAFMAGILSLPIPRPTKLPGLADTDPLYAPAAPKPIYPTGADAGSIGQSTNPKAVDENPGLRPDGRVAVGYVQYNRPVGVANPPVVLKPATRTTVKTAVAAPAVVVATVYVGH